MKEVVMKDVQEKQVFRGKVEEAMQEMRTILQKRVGEKAMAKAEAPPAPLLRRRRPAGSFRPVVYRQGRWVRADSRACRADADSSTGARRAAAPGSRRAAVAPAVAGPVIPPDPAGWERVYKNRPEIVINEMSSLMQELKRLPIQINEGKRRLELLQAKLDAVKNAPVSQLTLDMIEKDQDVVVQILKAKQAWREYEFRLNAAGDPNAPGVLDLKKAYDAHEVKLTSVRKEKADTFERARRVGEANKLAHEMETLIGSLQRQQEQYDTAKALLAKAEKQMLDLPLPGARPGARWEGVHLQPRTQRHRHHRRHLPPARSAVLPHADGTELAAAREGDSAGVEPDPEGREEADHRHRLRGAARVRADGPGRRGLRVDGPPRQFARRREVRHAGAGRRRDPRPAGRGDGPRSRAARGGERGDRQAADVCRPGLAGPRRDDRRRHQPARRRGQGVHRVRPGRAASPRAGTRRSWSTSTSAIPSSTPSRASPIRTACANCSAPRSTPPSAIQFLPSGLHLVPCGKWSDEARKAATGERLESLVTKLKGPYDCVVLHGHALLTAAESVEVARRCEVVLVCARYRETTTPLLKRAAERVAAMEIPYSGVVYVGATDQESLC